MNHGNHSEYYRLESVLLNPVHYVFEGPGKIQAEWQDLNYTAAPDLKKSQEEYREFEALFTERGISCLNLPTAQKVSLDAIYCRDASIATDHGMILCSMGKAQRRQEPSIHKSFYEANNIPVLGAVAPPGTLEGGDVAWLDKTTLAVGHSYRTNESGISQLKALLQPFGINILVAELPHYKGPQDVFHLMSVFSPVASDLAVVYSPLLPITFRKELLNRAYRLVEVPGSEIDTMGCNVLAISPKTCIMAAGNPLTEAALRATGQEVLIYQGAEISIKGGGGPTCLTRPLKRSV